MIPPADAGSAYWPRWRGPSGQGVVEETGYPETWSDTDNVVWKVEVPGRGNSSPIIWDDRIFLTTAYDNGVRRSVLCFRRSDGKLRWEVFAPDANPESPHPKNGYASATPTTDGERIYAYFGNHGLMAVNFDGKLAWHHPFDEMEPFHGTAGSPLLYKDSVIIYQDHQGGSSFVAAFDKRTGKVLWSTRRSERVGWGTPIAIRAGERDELIVSSQKRVQAYDPASGDELWSCGGNLFEVIPTPVVGHGLVFCSSGRAGPTLAIRPGGSGDVTKTHVAWKSPKGSPFVPSPLLYGDYLYMVNDMVSVATCYEAKTGRLMWQGRLGKSHREGFSASPIGVQGKVFFTNDEGETFVLKAGPEFELLHVNRLNARTLASPALVDGRWYFRTSRHLYSIGS
jgi:outer membrane protein assembly factor BamB